MNVLDGLLTLFLVCQKSDVSCLLEYSTGKFTVPPSDVVQQGPGGYTVEVGGNAWMDGDKEKLYPEIGAAVSAGLEMFARVMSERKNDL